MQIISSGDNLHEMSSLFFCEKQKKMPLISPLQISPSATKGLYAGSPVFVQKLRDYNGDTVWGFHSYIYVYISLFVLPTHFLNVVWHIQRQYM